MENEQQLIDLFKVLNDKPIAFHTCYVQITGSITASLLLSQLCYWDKTMDGQEFYKTNVELMKETQMSERELKNAKSKLLRLGLIQVKKKNIPPTTHYKVLKLAIIKRLFKQAETSHLNRPKRPICTGRNVPFNNTENTTENTTEKSPLKEVRESKIPNPSKQEIKVETSEKKEFGDVNINYLIQKLKTFNQMASLDSTVKSNRYAGKRVIDKIKKEIINQGVNIPTDQDIRTTIDFLLSSNRMDDFHARNLTSCDYLDRHFVQILKSCVLGPKTYISEG